MRSFKTAWNAACRRPGIADLHFHDLRREAACRLLEDGMPLQHPSVFFGHTSVARHALHFAQRNDQRRRVNAHCTFLAWVWSTFFQPRSPRTHTDAS